MRGAGHVLPIRPRLTDGDVRHLLAARLIPICQEYGAERVALEIGANEKTVRNARDQRQTLKLHSVFNLLAVDETALDAILDHYGFRLVRTEAQAANDMALVAQGAALTSIHAEAMEDGRRDHRETIAIAQRFRGLIAQYQPILDEADRIQGIKITGVRDV